MVYGYGCRQLAIAIVYIMSGDKAIQGLWNVLLVHNFSPRRQPYVPATLCLAEALCGVSDPCLHQYFAEACLSSFTRHLIAHWFVR